MNKIAVYWSGFARGGVLRGVSVAVALGVACAAGCTTDYVTGKRTFTLVTESQEIEMGREADPAIVAEYGLYDDAALAAFVNDLGQRMARVSQRPQLSYTFRVIDSPIVNAFALPGGYVYVTRGILAHFNSEDELAGVLGHEIGHVVARHGAEQMSRAQLAGLGLGIGVALSERFRQVADVVSAGVGLLFLSFSRGQESESDELGVEYSTKLGYDARRMAAFFSTLDRLGEKSGQTLPSFLSTHPDPGGREVRVHQLAGEWQAKLEYRPLNTSPADYLARIDGIVFGDDPRQGYRERDVFYHPRMRFQFPVPSGWTLANSPSRVQIVSGDEKAAVQLSLGKTGSASEEADAFVTKNKVAVRARSAATVGGYAAVILESTLDTEDGQIRLLSYFIRKDDHTFVFHGFSAAENFDNHRDAFASTMGGFRNVTDTAVLSKQPRRLRVRPAPSAGDFASVVRQMRVPEGDIADIAILNGRNESDPVAKGDRIKVVE